MLRRGEIRAIAGIAYLAGLHPFVAPTHSDDFSGLDVFERYPEYYRHLILSRMRWNHDAGHHAWHERDYPYCVRCTSRAYERLGIPPRSKGDHSVGAFAFVIGVVAVGALIASPVAA